MIGVWFTFSEDAGCLEQSVKAYRAIYPKDIVAICDDEASAIDEGIIKTIKPDYYEKRTWNSRRNLNGWTAIREILKLKIKLHELFPDHEGTLKIDSDTIILGNDWLDPSKPVVGFDIGTECVIAGCMRYVRADAAQRILDAVDSKWRWESANVPEDQGIANIALQIWGAELDCLEWVKFCESYKYDGYHRPASVVTFGNRRLIKQSGDRRKIAAEEMAKFLERQLQKS